MDQTARRASLLNDILHTPLPSKAVVIPLGTRQYPEDSNVQFGYILQQSGY